MARDAETDFAWILMPIFRVVEDLSLTRPRTFLKPASEDDSVPHQHNDDNVIPLARDISSHAIVVEEEEGHLQRSSVVSRCIRSISVPQQRIVA